MAKLVNQVWSIDNIEVPVRIYQEWRTSNRISITKDKVIVRVPKVVGLILKPAYKEWAIGWLKNQFNTDPNIKKRFIPKNYSTGDKIELAHKVYFLEISEEKRKTSTAKLYRDVQIKIVLNDQLGASIKSKTIHSLIYKILAKDNLERVTNRIHEINDQYFKEKIAAVRLKNNSSNWGSCSNNGNINISIKTLFAPKEIQDYVFIHELAHLIELNHSERYWKIVSDILPDYKKKEQWLKNYGSQCTF